MVDISQKISEQSGISIDTVQKGLGAILSFFNQNHGGEIVEQLKGAVPQHADMMAAFEQSKASLSSTSLLSSVAGLASKFLGGSLGDGSKLLENLGRAGLSLDQITKFVPFVIQNLQSVLPPEVFAKIKELLMSATGLQKK